VSKAGRGPRWGSRRHRGELEVSAAGTPESGRVVAASETTPASEPTGRGASTDEPWLSVIIPTYNEARRLEPMLERVGQVFAEGILDAATTEVIVVDDGSSDATAALAAELVQPFERAMVLRLPEHRGKGAAVRHGVARASGAVVAYMDADLSVDPSGLPALLRRLADAEVAIGSRALEESLVDCRSVTRVVMGRLFNRLVKAQTGLPYLDTQCGFKAFRGPVARLLFHLGSLERFAFDVELLMLAERLGLRIAEAPVVWRFCPGSKVHLLRDPLEMASDVARVRLGLLPRRPVPGLLARPRGWRGRVRDAHLEAVRQSVRRTDVVVLTDEGVVILMPLLRGPELERSVASLARRLRDWQVEETTLAPRTVLALAPLCNRLLATAAAGREANEPTEAGRAAPDSVARGEDGGVEHRGSDPRTGRFGSPRRTSAAPTPALGADRREARQGGTRGGAAPARRGGTALAPR
jgi:dolichyl-phosphate beta-glucosyltransferase